MVKINEYGEIIRDNVIQNKSDPLWDEYQKLEYEVLNNHHNPTKDSEKIARYNQLKEHFNIKKSEEAFQKAKDKLRKKIIASNNSDDKNINYIAITQFQKTNE